MLHVCPLSWVRLISGLVVGAKLLIVLVLSTLTLPSNKTYIHNCNIKSVVQDYAGASVWLYECAGWCDDIGQSKFDILHMNLFKLTPMLCGAKCCGVAFIQIFIHVICYLIYNYCFSFHFFSISPNTGSMRQIYLHSWLNLVCHCVRREYVFVVIRHAMWRINTNKTVLFVSVTLKIHLILFIVIGMATTSSELL